MTPSTEDLIKLIATNLPWELKSLVLSVRDDNPYRTQIPDFIWIAGEELNLVYLNHGYPALTDLGRKVADNCYC